MTVSQDEFQARIDANLKKAQETVAGTVPLTKPRPPSPLSAVPVDPSLVHPPILTDQEKIDAYDKLSEVEVARIKYEQAKKDNPIVYYVSSWWRLLAGGDGGFLLSYLVKGCG